MSDESTGGDTTPADGPNPAEATSDWRSPEGRAVRAENKRLVLTKRLELGRVMIHVDARRPGVEVPVRFAREADLPLNLSWRFAHTEMEIDGDGVAATLTFGGVPFRCELPWAAIWGIDVGNQSTQIWEPDLPEELGGPSKQNNEEPPPRRPGSRRKARLTSIAGGVSDADAPAEVAPSEPPPASPSSEGAAKPPAPWLRLVR